jgi:hypothetical protein
MLLLRAMEYVSLHSWRRRHNSAVTSTTRSLTLAFDSTNRTERTNCVPGRSLLLRVRPAKDDALRRSHLLVLSTLNLMHNMLQPSHGVKITRSVPHANGSDAAPHTYGICHLGSWRTLLYKTTRSPSHESTPLRRKRRILRTAQRINVRALSLLLSKQLAQGADPRPPLHALTLPKP